MRVGSYVLFDDIVWTVWREHTDGSIQIKTIEPLRTWINNIQVSPKDCIPITKEVVDIMRGV